MVPRLMLWCGRKCDVSEPGGDSLLHVSIFCKLFGQALLKSFKEMKMMGCKIRMVWRMVHSDITSHSMGPSNFHLCGSSFDLDMADGPRLFHCVIVFIVGIPQIFC